MLAWSTRARERATRDAAAGTVARVRRAAGRGGARRSEYPRGAGRWALPRALCRAVCSRMCRVSAAGRSQSRVGGTGAPRESGGGSP